MTSSTLLRDACEFVNADVNMLKIIFLHPDLGIGGAERLVVDAATALASCGHTTQFVTTHHDANHCFTETKDGSIPVTVAGDWIPRSVFGYCFALCAYMRMVYAAVYLGSLIALIWDGTDFS